MTLSNDTSVPARLGDGAPSPGPNRCGSAGKLVSLVVSTYTDNHHYRERGFRPVLGFDHSRRSDSPFERRCSQLKNFRWPSVGRRSVFTVSQAPRSFEASDSLPTTGTIRQARCRTPDTRLSYARWPIPPSTAPTSPKDDYWQSGGSRTVQRISWRTTEPR